MARIIKHLAEVKVNTEFLHNEHFNLFLTIISTPPAVKDPCEEENVLM